MSTLNLQRQPDLLLDFPFGDITVSPSGRIFVKGPPESVPNNIAIFDANDGFQLNEALTSEARDRLKTITDHLDGIEPDETIVETIKCEAWPQLTDVIGGVPQNRPFAPGVVNPVLKYKMLLGTRCSEVSERGMLVGAYAYMKWAAPVQKGFPAEMQYYEPDGKTLKPLEVTANTVLILHVDEHGELHKEWRVEQTPDLVEADRGKRTDPRAFQLAAEKHLNAQTHFNGMLPPWSILRKQNGWTCHPLPASQGQEPALRFEHTDSAYNSSFGRLAQIFKRSTGVDIMSPLNEEAAWVMVAPQDPQVSGPCTLYECGTHMVQAHTVDLEKNPEEYVFPAPGRILYGVQSGRPSISRWSF